jgi:quinol monooxygenase YgiN
VFIFEVYDNAAAFEAHRATDHFKKYALGDTGRHAASKVLAN